MTIYIKMLELFEEGYTQAEVARMLGYSKQYVHSVLKRNGYKYLKPGKKEDIRPSVIDKLKFALGILMEGRTFYDGYFDKPFENLSRIDQATYVLLQVIKEQTNE